MKITSTLASLVGFALIGFLWAGEASATWPGSRRRSFRRPSLRRLCQSAEPQSIDEPTWWRRRQHTSALPRNQERRRRNAATRRYAWGGAAAQCGTGRRSQPPERTTRRRNAAAGRSFRRAPRDLAEARAGSSGPAVKAERAAPAAGLAASGRAERTGSERALEAKVGASGRGCRWREPAARRRGREPPRRVVRPAL